MINAQEAQRLLAQEQTPTISAEEAKKLLAQDSLDNDQPMGLYPSPGLSETQTSNMARALLAGLLKTGQGIGELQAKGLRALGAPIRPLNQTMASDQATGINGLYSAEVAATPEGKAGFFGGGLIPYLTPAGLTRASAELAPKAIPAIFKELLNQTGILGLTAPISQPESSIGEAEKEAFTNPLAALGLGLSPALAGASHGLSKVKNAISTLGGKASPEEVMRRAASIGDIQIPAGDLIDSDFLRGLQSKLNYIPGGAQEDINKGIKKSLQSKVENSLNEMDKNPDIDAGKMGIKALQNSRKYYESRNNALFKNFTDSIEDSSSSVVHKNRTEEAQKIREELEKMPNSSKDDDYDKFLKEVSSAAKKNPTLAGEKFNTSSFKDSSLYRAHLNEYIDSLYNKGQKNLANKAVRLKKATEKDIEESAVNAGNPEVYRKYLEAKQDYINNVSPFYEDNSLNKYSNPISKANSDKFVKTFIKSDEPEKASMLSKYLSRDQMEKIIQDHLTKESRNVNGKIRVNHDDILNKYAKMNDAMKDISFSPDKKQELDNLLETRDLLGGKIKNIGKGSKSDYQTMSRIGLGITPISPLLFGASRYARNKLFSKELIDKYVQAALRKQNQQPSQISRLPALTYPAYLQYQNQGGQ